MWRRAGPRLSAPRPNRLPARRTQPPPPAPIVPTSSPARSARSLPNGLATLADRNVRAPFYAFIAVVHLPFRRSVVRIRIRCFPLRRFRGEAAGLHSIQRESRKEVAGYFVNCCSSCLHSFHQVSSWGRLSLFQRRLVSSAFFIQTDCLAYWTCPSQKAMFAPPLCQFPTPGTSAPGKM